MGMTLRTSDEQTEALRRQAAAEGRSMQAVALSAIDEYIARRDAQGESRRSTRAGSRRGGERVGAPQGRMIEYLDLEDLLEVARRAVGEDVAVRDYGLLESALARPRASVFGQDAYPDVHRKAAALLQSLARNHALDRREQAPRLGRLSHIPGPSTASGSRASEDQRFELGHPR